MLDFLLGVASLVYELFTSLFSYLRWYVYNAFGRVSEYVNNLAPNLQDYSWYRAVSLIYYQYVGRPYTDDIAVNHYGDAKYVTQDSKGDIQAYRSQHKKPLEEYSYNLGWFLRKLVNEGWGQVATLFSYGPWHINRNLSTLNNSEEQYIASERAPLQDLLLDKGVLKRFAEPAKKVPLFDFADNLYTNLRTVATTFFPDVKALVAKTGNLLQLGIDTITANTVDLSGKHYPTILALLLKNPWIQALTEAQRYARLAYLSDEGFSALDAIIQAPQHIILDWIEETFLPWFFEQLWKYLTETEA